MELVYVWVEKFRNIEKQGYLLSPNFLVDYDCENKKLKIERNETHFGLFNDTIDNVTAIIGKNGSGKTNILDLLGMRTGFRKENSQRDKYFVIYHHEEDIFSFEGSGFELIKSNILGTQEDINPFIYSICLKKIGDAFEYRGFLQGREEWRKKQVRYIYYRRWKNTRYNKESDYSLYFPRSYLNSDHIGNYPKYRLIVHYNKENIEGLFSSNCVSVRVGKNIPYRSVDGIELKKRAPSKINIYRLGKKQRRTSKEIKDIFILGLLENYVLHMIDSLSSMIAAIPFKSIVDDINKVQETEDVKEYFLSVLKIATQAIVDNDRSQRGGGNLYYDSFYELVKHLELLHEGYFYTDYIDIPIGVIEDKVTVDFLKFIDEKYQTDYINYLNNALDIEFQPFSSGEDAFINLFASLYYGISNFSSEGDKLLILLDEPDNYMHPEWSRRLLTEVFRLLNKSLGRRYQLIMTTHSPFIASDLPKSNVIILDKCHESGRSITTSLDKTEQTFASNIHTLLSSEFFMQSTIGEFAKTRIDQVISLLKEGGALTIEQREVIKFVIDLIGDPLLQDALRNMYMRKIGREAWLEEQLKKYDAELRAIKEQKRS